MKSGLITCAVLIVIVACCSGCGAVWHLKRSKFHEARAIELGAKVDEDIDSTKHEGTITPPTIVTKTDTVYTPLDTLVITKDNVITKIVVKAGKRIYVHTTVHPKPVKYVQTIYINKVRTIKSGFTKGQRIWAMISGLVVGIIIGGLAVMAWKR